ISPQMMVLYRFFFFFSSRRRHTRFSRDWSSDVCSSDLDAGFAMKAVEWKPVTGDGATVDVRALSGEATPTVAYARTAFDAGEGRSEERRVGKECRCGWERDDEKKKKKWGRGVRKGMMQS